MKLWCISDWVVGKILKGGDAYDDEKWMSATLWHVTFRVNWTRPSIKYVNIYITEIYVALIFAVWKIFNWKRYIVF